MSFNDPVLAFLDHAHQEVKPVISIDVDNTLAFFTSHILAVINAQFDTDYKIKDQTKPALHFLKGEELMYAIKQHSKPAFFATMAPDYAAIASVQAIKNAGYYVVIASSRQSDMEKVTTKWLNKWGIPYDEVHVGPGEKAKESQKHSIDNPIIFIDDNPHIDIKISRPGSQVRLLRRPYTGDIKDMDDIKVVDTWQQILSELKIEVPNKIPQLTIPPLGLE